MVAILQRGLGAQKWVLKRCPTTRQRDQAASDLVRALLIINGGGAAALLAFLQTRLWPRSTIISLVIFSAGAALGAAFHLFRHQA